MRSILVLFFILASSTVFADTTTFVGYIADYSCGNYCKATILGVADLGGATYTQILTLDAPNFSKTKLAALSGHLQDLIVNSRANELISATPHVGKPVCGKFYEWNNCP
jgi:hypothetical protein